MRSVELDRALAERDQRSSGELTFASATSPGFRAVNGATQAFEGPTDEIPAGPFNGRPLAIGSSDTGVINTPGDRDGFAVELVAGQSYVFTLTGTGDSPLIDPFLEIYGQTTELLAIDDDGGPGRDALMRFTAQTTGTYYINALAWDAYDPADGPPTLTGGYTITAALGPPQNPLDTIDLGFVLSSTSVSVYFATAGQIFDGVTASRSWTSTEIAAAMAAMATFSAVTILTFTQATVSAGATFIMSLAELEPGTLGQFTSNGAGGFGVFDPTNQFWSPLQLQPGGQGFVTLVHEVGHGLGLAHPHDNGGLGGDNSSEIMQGVTEPFRDTGTFGLNVGYATIMSYNSSNELGPGTLDIALLQQKYGANTTANAGDNVYTISDVISPVPANQVIWDVGGIDSIVYSGWRQVNIDLRPATLLNERGGGGFVSAPTGSAGGFVIAHGVVVENATGSSSFDQIHGNDAANILDGGEGDDFLWGLAGADTLIGGIGADWVQYDSDPAGVVLNLQTQSAIDGWGATDTLISVENIIGSPFDDTLIGGAGGVLGRSWIEGGAGADIIEDHSTSEGTLVGGEGDDTLVGSDARSILLAGPGDDILSGEGDNDVLSGDEGNDFLDGGSGIDRMFGGDGSDTYVVDDPNDDVVEDILGGVDLVQARISHTLLSNVENLTLLGSVNINGTGNDLANIIVGNAGSNTLDGGAGADMLIGGLGNDIFVVDDAGDVVTEAENEGTDRINTSISFTLALNVENLLLTGTASINGAGNFLANTISGNAGANSLFGGTGDDTLFGNDGNDRLDGSTGNDAMKGGFGDDIYIVDAAGDTVTDEFNGGLDRVDASISYALGSNVENLVLQGTANLNGSGNFLANTIVGNAGNNSLFGGTGDDILFGNDGNDRLDGATGNDTMKGGFGDDIYIVDSAGDVVTDEFNGGTDRVDASVSYALGSNVENLVLQGTANLNGSGNFLANTIVGNAGNNSLFGGTGDDILFGNDGNDRLDGATGTDTMKGGLGDDIYIVDSATDVTTEDVGQGTDRIDAYVSYTIGVNIENMVLQGTGAINGTGNFVNNTILGNTGDNILAGLGGNDTLNGGAGNDQLDGGVGIDRLTGGLGADAFVFSAALGTGVDQILDFNAAEDVIWLDDAIYTGLTTGALTADAFAIGSSASDALDRLIYDPTNGALYYDADGNGAGAAVQIATLSTGLALTAANFFGI